MANRREMLTVSEVAERLRVSEYSVRRYINSGRLKAVALGKEYRVFADDLDFFLTRLSNRLLKRKPEAPRE